MKKIYLISVAFVFIALSFNACNSSKNAIGNVTTGLTMRDSLYAAIFPEPKGYVNDFSKILTPKQESELTEILKNHEKKKGNQIAIVTIDSIAPYSTLFEYSLDMANYWGLGEHGKDNGILIAVSKNLRRIEIQNGNGLVLDITDEETEQVIQDIIIPEFKKGKYFEGLKSGVIAIIKELE